METAAGAQKVAPDRELADIVDYVMTYKVDSGEAMDMARLCVADTLACAFDALDFEECTRLLGPLVDGTVVPNGARVPGTRHVLDPAAAAFSFGSMIRWLDLNDTFAAATGGHPRSEEHTSELQSLRHLVCRLLLEKNK